MDHTPRNNLVKKKALELRVFYRRPPTAEELVESLNCENYRPEDEPDFDFKSPEYRARVDFRHLRQDARLALARRMLKELGAKPPGKPV